MIIGTVTRQGIYTDGNDIYEIYINQGSAHRLSHEYRRKTPLLLSIANTLYGAGVHETREGVVWISSVLFKKGPKREKVRLVDVLADIGLSTGDKVKIENNSDGTFLLQSYQSGTA
jgi:hypothetical protein